MQGMITDPKLAKEFILAGNATVTFVSKKSGNRFTYRIQAKPNKKNPDVPFYKVGLLTGPDNTSDYTPIGIIVESRFILPKWAREEKSMTETTPSVAALIWTLNNHLSKGVTPPMTEIWCEGRCGRCGRKLTVPESLMIGLGADCLAKS